MKRQWHRVDVNLDILCAGLFLNAHTVFQKLCGQFVSVCQTGDLTATAPLATWQLKVKNLMSRYSTFLNPVTKLVWWVHWHLALLLSNTIQVCYTNTHSICWLWFMSRVVRGYAALTTRMTPLFSIHLQYAHHMIHHMLNVSMQLSDGAYQCQVAQPWHLFRSRDISTHTWHFIILFYVTVSLMCHETDMHNCNV